MGNCLPNDCMVSVKMNNNTLNLLLNKERLESALHDMTTHITRNEALLTEMANVSVKIIVTLDLIDRLISLQQNHDMLTSKTDDMFKTEELWDEIAVNCKRIAYTSFKLRKIGLLQNMLQ